MFQQNVFFRFLLLKCYKKLCNKQGLKCHLKTWFNIFGKHSHSICLCDYLLLGEVAEMAGNDALAPEIYKSWLVLTFEAIDVLIDAENRAMTTALDKTESLKELLLANSGLVFKKWFKEAFGVDDMTTSFAHKTFEKFKSHMLSVAKDIHISDGYLKEHLELKLPECLFNGSFTTRISQGSSEANGNYILSKDMKRNEYRSIRTNQKIYLWLLFPDTPITRCLNISSSPHVKFFLPGICKGDSKNVWSSMFIEYDDVLVHSDDYSFSKYFFTISDAVYIAQHGIKLNEYQKAIDILEKVVSKDYHYPRSVIIWPKELINLIDDDVKSEILKSPNGYIALPSVVYALYLLAKIYHSIGDREAFEDTKVRFIDVCGYLGDVSPISSTLLELVHNLTQHGNYGELDLD